ncbi:hypothetical protein [Mucilaginibacter sp. 10I4]|uniref:hypothetical protein n=1 Tax=Mucilaginibacter sp. 10I4 TaxID=3048580 RepID=UPI002B22B64E|nr:hypothetical protein [Mucilaginibacter sp. 10I4]MEB0262881.1 hypothetical protein [Mucilaginibacter sp. 10I4]
MKILSQEFKAQLNQLQDDVDSKEAQIAILESEMLDAVMPSNLIIDIKSTIMDMMFEIVVFEKSKGITEKSTASKNRLNGLLQGIDELNGISSANYNLKAANRLIHTKYQMLRVVNSELKAQVKKMVDTETFLAGN